MTGSVVVRNVEEIDREAWSELFRGYRDFYGKAHDSAVIDTVWECIIDPMHGTRCLIAESEGRPIGLGHYRAFLRPIDGRMGLYLDDLFTAPNARGTGAATAILQYLAGVAHEEGASLVRWITADTNETARRLYDRVASQTSWVTYDLVPAARGQAQSGSI